MEPMTLGENVLSLLDESARTSTYKPALLLAILDRAQEHPDGVIPVRDLAERVVELYWPQTLAYETTGQVLLQNQGGQATIVRDLTQFRASRGLTSRALSGSVRTGRDWEQLLAAVERALAEWPIPRLQRPDAQFLYTFDWGWRDGGGWSATAYRASSRSIALRAGVHGGLVSLGPLLRPFITRWWTDKAAQLNPQVDAARSLLEFEHFLFGRDRVALQRIGESLLDLQHGDCFFCGRRIGRQREIDHFIPWSYSGDDGLDNLVAACRVCNNDKRAALPGPFHVTALHVRNLQWASDLAAIADEKRWPRNERRSLAIARTAYVSGPDERVLWTCGDGGVATRTRLGDERVRMLEIFA